MIGLFGYGRIGKEYHSILNTLGYNPSFICTSSKVPTQVPSNDYFYCFDTLPPELVSSCSIFLSLHRHLRLSRFFPSFLKILLFFGKTWISFFRRVSVLYRFLFSEFLSNIYLAFNRRFYSSFQFLKDKLLANRASTSIVMDIYDPFANLVS